MDSGAHKLLESAAHRTLHAHNFSRSSSQASLVLTDLLSRYLALLASTCTKYAGHTGRRRFTATDVVLALDELGVSIQELKEFGSTEGIELNRYALKSMRRVEDLAEFRVQLNDGLRGDRDDCLPLQYTHVLPEYEISEENEYDGEDCLENIDVDMEYVGAKRPFSPLPSPSSPKRPRTLLWEPPPHIPDFLPPFPKDIDAAPPPSASHSPSLPPLPELSSSSMAQAENTQSATLATQDIAAATTSTAASDYLVPVPYSDSSLSSVPEWHLPSAPPRKILQSQPQSQQHCWPTPMTEPSLIGAYHHILTNPPSNNQQSNPARHKVAMALLNLTQTQPRWEVADTLYSNVATNQPRVAPIGATFPMMLGDNLEKDREKKESGKEKEVKFPTTMPRSVAANERLSFTVAQQGSRIPELARHVLPPNIFARTSRLTHPPVLIRGTKQLIYGNGVPAPWNANLVPTTDLTAKDGGGTGSGVNGIVKGDPPPKSVLPDARLFATWDYEPKDYRAPIPTHLRRGRIGGGPGVGVAVGARGRSTSTKTG